MRRLLLMVVLVGSGCFEAQVEPDAVIACGVASDCPEGFVCATTLSPPRCVVAGGDSVAPVLGGLFVTPLSGADDLVEACVDSNETAAFGRVTIGGLVIEAVINGFRVCAGIAATSLGEGVHGVQVLVVDLAGNATEVGLGTVIVDLTPPAVTLGPLLSATNTAALGDQVVVAISATEALAGAATLRWSGALSGERIIELGTTVSTTIDLTGAGDGALELTLEGAQDLAGNVAVAARAGFLVDASPPVIVAVAVPGRVSRVAGFDDITATVEVVDADTVELIVGSDVVACGRDQGDTFTCAATVGDSSLPPGPSTLAIQARDVAGNVSERFVVITLDDHGPVVAAMLSTLPPHPVHPQRTRAPLGGQATLTLTFDELLSQPPTLQTSRGGVTCEASASRQVFACTWQAPTEAVSGDRDEEAVFFNVEAVDTVGNAQTTVAVTPSPALVLDTRATVPPVDAPGVVVVTRQQNGAITLEGTPPGTWEPGAFIVVRGPSASIAAAFVVDETGAAPPRPLDGAFERVSVEQIDAAGNASAAVLVRRYQTRVDVVLDREVVGELAVAVADPRIQGVRSATIDPNSGDVLFVEEFEDGCNTRQRLCRTSSPTATSCAFSTVVALAGVAGEGVLAIVNDQVALVGEDLATTPIAAPPDCVGSQGLGLLGSADGQGAVLRCGTSRFQRVAGAWNALPGTDPLSFAPDGRLERLANGRRVRLDDNVDVGPAPCSSPSGRVPMAGAEGWFCDGTTFIALNGEVIEVATPDRTDDFALAGYVVDGACALRLGGVQVNDCAIDCGFCGFGESEPIGISRRLCVEDVLVQTSAQATLQLPFAGVPVAASISFAGPAAVASTTTTGASSQIGTLSLISTTQPTSSTTIALDGADDVVGELVLPPTSRATVDVVVRATAGTTRIASLSAALTLTLTVDLAP